MIEIADRQTDRQRDRLERGAVETSEVDVCQVNDLTE